MEKAIESIVSAAVAYAVVHILFVTFPVQPKIPRVK